ncbi:MAG TPA: hypothetical protein GXX29_06685 [Firmicutes bacterium]|nr:hypothetical protein [Bacillota bacterium]
MKRWYQGFINLPTAWSAAAAVAFPVVCLLVLVVCLPVAATGPRSAGMAGVEVALSPEAIPLNPAAAGGIAEDQFYFGFSLPAAVGGGAGGGGATYYISLHQPADALDSGLAGTLSYVRSRQPFIDAATGKTVYRHKDHVVYQIAEAFAGGYVGVSARWFKERQEGTSLAGEAWRVDVGLQNTLWNRLTIGLVGQDLIGSSQKWSDGTEIARQPTWRAGAGFQFGPSLLVAAEAWDWANYVPGSWSVGLEVNPLAALSLRGGYQVDGGKQSYTVGGSAHFGHWHFSAGGVVRSTWRGYLGAAVEF